MGGVRSPESSEARERLLQQLGERILKITLNHPTRVAIDGVDGSGKTFIADELAKKLRASGRQIIRVSVDKFHNPRIVRYQKGRSSPEGYYADSFNNTLVIENVLRPLGPNGDRKFKSAAFDYKNDTEIIAPVETAEPNAILLMDGIFLQRPELADYWDLKILLDVDFEHTVARAVKRDASFGGSEQEIEKVYDERYVPGQRLYFEKVDPKAAADIVIDNTDFKNPRFVKDIADPGATTRH
jgi:uridine kinase